MGKIKHGHSPEGRPSPEYRAWAAMKNRCLNARQARFKDYGERGISICDRWLRGENGRSAFECFLEDVGPKPSEDHSLDRRNNDRGYEPGNVRWATRIEQARNTRAGRFVDIGAGEMTVAEAIERHGAASASTVYMRLARGWSPDDAILTPPGGKPPKPFPFPEVSP